MRRNSLVDAGSAIPGSFAWSKAHSDALGHAASRDPRKVLVGALRTADAVLIFGMSIIAFVLRHGLKPVPLDIVAIAGFTSLLTANLISIMGAYDGRLSMDATAQMKCVTKAWTVAYVLLAVLGFFSHTIDEYSRIWVGIWYFSVLGGFAIIRLAAAGQVVRWKNRGAMASIVAIVDFTGEGADLARRIAPSNLADVRLIGVFSSEDPTLSQKGIGDLLALSRLFRIDDIFVLISDRAVNEASDKIASVLRRLGTVPANVRLCRLPLQLERVPLREPEVLHGVSTLTIHRCPLRSWSGVAKRAEDIIVGVAALPLLLPVMAVAAIAIKCDSPGPVLFRQARYGFNNNVITVLKFRTMKHRHSQEPDGWVRQATRNDDRVTRVGRILRRTSIDELPQIFNVLRGNMALVGPRPHAVPHNEQYAALIDNYLGRHRVQPGMTGWAQVNGLRGETDTIEKMQKRVEHDLYYIEHWSIALDLRIIFMTAVQGLLHREAY